MKRIFSFVLCACTLLAAPPPAPRPKLLVAIVIDQFRYDYLTRFAASYTGGFKRMLSGGAFYTNAHYIHVPTVTAIGHSTFLSGATPSVSGIIGNEWFDRASGHDVTSVSDPGTALLGGKPGAKGSSPHRLLVSTLGDEMKIAGVAGKVIGVSIKDRAAILPSGHMADGAYWFDDSTGHFVSSTYYFSTLPDWVEQFDSAGADAPYKGKSWRALDAKPADPPFCVYASTDRATSCGAIAATPFGNEMLEKFAERAIASEKLGTHPGADVLTISFSSNDYVGHAWGPDSTRVRDISIRTDRIIGSLLTFLDAHLGAGRYVVVLTGDHGVAPVPEVNTERKMPGGRLNWFNLIASVNDALTGHYGAGHWVASSSPGEIYLDLATLASHHANPAEARRIAANAALASPHVARVYTRDDLLAGIDSGDTISRAMRNGFYGPRSGDVFVLPEPYFLYTPRGTTHGTPYGYDRHVPILLYGAGIVPGVHHDDVLVNDIAPTLADLFHVEAPSGAFGRVLPGALR